MVREKIMTIKSIKIIAEASLRPPRAQEILGVTINRGPLNEIRKDSDPNYKAGEIDG